MMNMLLNVHQNLLVVKTMFNNCISFFMSSKVGYDAGDQFSFHWWDHVFNKAAKSIVVQENDVRTSYKQ